MVQYLDLTKQRRIDDLIKGMQLVSGLSYPENSLIGIIEAWIPEVSILEYEFGAAKIRGAIYKKSPQFKQPLIVVEKSLAPEVKTFTLAHEFGHYSLDHPAPSNFLLDKIGQANKTQEAEAQYFAASLLMPKDKFTQLMLVLDDKKLAERFGVSVSAVRVRKQWLNGSEK